MLFQHFDWGLTHQVVFIYILPNNNLWPSLRDQPWRCTDNPFPVPYLCKLNHISVCFIQISTNITAYIFIFLFFVRHRIHLGSQKLSTFMKTLSTFMKILTITQYLYENIYGILGSLTVYITCNQKVVYTSIKLTINVIWKYNGMR